MSEWKVAWEYQPMNFRAFPVQSSHERQAVTFLNNISGDGLRIFLSIRYSTNTLKIRRAAVCVENGPKLPVTFCGDRELLLKPGEDSCSDPVDVRLTRQGEITVLLDVPAQSMETACSFFPNECAGVSITDLDTGEKKSQAKTGLLRLEEEQCCFYGFCRAEIRSSDPVSTIVCFGDSITHRAIWTGPFTEKVYRLRPGGASVLNYGVSGNRVLYDESPYTDFGNWFGKRGIRRIAGELADIPDLTGVIVLQGINDIYHYLSRICLEDENPTASMLIDGLKFYAQSIHARKAKACICTITPFNNAGEVWNEEAERIREEVNRWIRETDSYDLVADFDAAIRNPEDATRMIRAYDSGDGLHPSYEGGRKMAEVFTDEMIRKLL